MHTRLAIMFCLGLLMFSPFAYAMFKHGFNKGFGAWQAISLLYGGTTMLLAISLPFGSQIVDFLNWLAPYMGWCIVIAVMLAFVPSYHIAPTLYGTHGVSEPYRFIRHEVRVGYAKYDWQMMKPVLGGLLWRATDNIINEHECNYFKVKP